MRGNIAIVLMVTVYMTIVPAQDEGTFVVLRRAENNPMTHKAMQAVLQDYRAWEKKRDEDRFWGTLTPKQSE
jgi:hypothetical protein